MVCVTEASFRNSFSVVIIAMCAARAQGRHARMQFPNAPQRCCRIVVMLTGDSDSRINYYLGINNKYSFYSFPHSELLTCIL